MTSSAQALSISLLTFRISPSFESYFPQRYNAAGKNHTEGKENMQGQIKQRKRNKGKESAGRKHAGELYV
jgi:hypothetical protein